MHTDTGRGAAPALQKGVEQIAACLFEICSLYRTAPPCEDDPVSYGCTLSSHNPADMPPLYAWQTMISTTSAHLILTAELRESIF
jgi:hypothetical protein